MARYRIEPELSHVWVDARSNLHPIHSTTDGLEGFVELNVESAGEVDLAVAPAGKLSLQVNKLSSGNRLEDREMHKRIDSRRYPTIDGVLDQMQKNGQANTYRVSGEITFRGVSKRHEDEMTIHEIDDHTISLQGSSRFDIREFGMQPPKMLMLKVDPEVEVRIEIVATREA
jgi:polyisoprenoid-binding protein YceI